jgi:flagellar basal-body rod protein FlgF
MSAKVTRQEFLADNLANVTTPGFKTQRAFLSVLKTKIGRAGAAADSEQVVSSYTDFSQGPIEPTHSKLDLAIDGDGFFVIDTPEGEKYTRCGNFTLTAEGFLATQAGHPVMGSGGPIPIIGQEVTVTPEGTVMVDNEEIGALRIVTFPNPQDLVRNGNKYAAVAGMAREADMNQTRIIQGGLERSNVSPIDEMVEMITIQRGFEADQKSINLQDQSTKQLIERAGSSGRG